MSEETYNRDPTKQLNIVSTASAAQGETVPVEFSARQSNFSDKHSTEPRPGRLVESCSLSSVHPQQFITNYISFLVERIGETAGEHFSEAQALVEVIGIGLQNKTNWEPSFVETILDLIKTHSAFETQRKQTEFNTIVSRLELFGTKKAHHVKKLPVMSNFVSGLADRISEERGVSSIFAELGAPSTLNVATFRDVLADFSRNSGQSLNESGLADLIYFFSDKTSESPAAQTEVIGLSSSILGSFIPGRGADSTSWNLETVAKVLSEDYGMYDWNAVAAHFDMPKFLINNTNQFKSLLDLYRAGAKSTPPLSAFTGQWRNSACQLSVFEAMMNVPPSVFMVPLDEEELKDAAPGQGISNSPNPQFWASMDILQRLLHLSDVPALYRKVRDLFVRCLLTCPEVLLCSLVRLQLRVANAGQAGGGLSAGMQMKQELMRELIPLFFRPSRHRVQNGPDALRRLYAISPTTVMAACFEAWRSSAQDSPQARLGAIVHIINIARYLPNPAEAVASLLSGGRDAEFSISIAFVMADNDFLQLKPWLGEKLSSSGSATKFAVALISFLRKTYTTAAPKAAHSSGSAPLVSLDNVTTSLELLQSLDQTILSQPAGDRGSPTVGEAVRSLVEACLAAHPSLRSTISISNIVPTQRSTSGTANQVVPSEVEEITTAYFQKIYTSELSISDVVEMLRRFKVSGVAKENEIYACMVHNLYDEYRFFAKYPEKELRITGILFGALIQEQLVSSITLGIALRYVLEALRKPPAVAGAGPSSGKMFRFGMFALEQFKGRLHEWPQYCSHIVQIPHLKEGYAELVAEIEQEMMKGQARTASNDGTPQRSVSQGSADSFSADADSLPDPVIGSSTSSQHSVGTSSSRNDKPMRVAEFGPGLGRAVSEASDEEPDFEAPADATLARVQFLVNNLAPSNVETKAAELQELLDPRFFGWLGHFLVVKRISTQANFHSLFLLFLDNLGEYGRGLVEAILRSSYQSIGKLLRSSKITTSSSERSYLKNLGIWLGQITLSRNRPIKQIMLDCRELLLQGYETGKLIAVAPFLAKTLEGAKNSVIFRPPNPWLMGLLGVFRSVYNVDGLKMNIKFEVEVLCKNLGIRLEDIPLRNSILASRIAPVKERNPDFNIKSAAQKSQGRAGLLSSELVKGDDTGRTTPTGPGEISDTLIPNLAAYVTVNASLPRILQSQTGSVLSTINVAMLKRWVPIAVDRAIREIIQPVVERSVTIACITTKEIVTKDFAMESDENKMRKAGQLMVANLAGSLALVTCREPLRSSVSSHLRQLLTSNIGGGSDSLSSQEQNVIEQCVQICATDNLEIGCKLIEKAATEKAVRDVDDALEDAMSIRRKHREKTGQPYYDMSIFSNANQRYPAALPDQLRPTPGGLQAEHFQLYESFQRMSRNQGQNVALAPAPTSSRPFAQPGATSVETMSSGLGARQGSSSHFGTELLASVASKLDAAVSALLAAAGARAREIKLSMLPHDHQISQLLAAVSEIMPNSAPGGGVSRALNTSEQELVLSFSQSIFKRLYEFSLSEPLRLEALVALLEHINKYCPKLGKDMGTWATYAPTNTEPQRRLHRTVLLLLIRSNLLAVADLDNFLSARADNGRSAVWVDFAVVFMRTAFVENIAAPTDFPKLVQLMASIAEGRSQASPQLAQTVRQPIVQMLEDGRGRNASTEQNEPAVPVAAPAPPSAPRVSDVPASSAPSAQQIAEASSLSAESLTRMAAAAKKIAEMTEMYCKCDPQGSQQQVTALLESWIRLQSDEKAVGQYLVALKTWGVGQSEEKTERFLRLSAVVVVDAVLKTAKKNEDGSRASLNYGAIDLYCKLLQLLFRHMNSGGTAEQVNAQRLGVLNKIVGSVVRAMIWHNVKRVGGQPWDQRPWYRIFLNLLIDTNKPGPMTEPIRLQVLSIFGVAFHSCQPLILPGFAFAWLELVSHRHFLPNLLLFPERKAWNIAHQLLIDQFLFMEPYLRRIQLTPPVKKLYEGTLRVLLVLLHDFPSFLTGYHLSFCNVVPENCVQLRNIILSASPKGISAPDPFTPNLKIDLLPESTRSPPVLSYVIGPIEKMSAHLDAYFRDGQRRGLPAGLLSLLYKEGTTEVDPCKANSLVVYVGAHALARLQTPQISLSRTPDTELFQKLMELDDHGRYRCLNAIANQLRFPSSHTHYFSCVMLYLFSESKSVAVKEQVTRVLLERLIVHRPHPWGLLITFIELIKNQRYGFWQYPFTRCAAEIERVFTSVARSCLPPGTQRSALVGGDDP